MKLKAGALVDRYLSIAGCITSEPAKVAKVTKQGVFLDDDSGPYNAKTGEHCDPFYGATYIKPRRGKK